MKLDSDNQSSSEDCHSLYSQVTDVDTLDLYNIELHIVLSLIEEDETAFELIQLYINNQSKRYH